MSIVAFEILILCQSVLIPGHDKMLIPDDDKVSMLRHVFDDFESLKRT